MKDDCEDEELDDESLVPFTWKNLGERSPILHLTPTNILLFIHHFSLSSYAKKMARLKRIVELTRMKVFILWDIFTIGTIKTILRSE